MRGGTTDWRRRDAVRLEDQVMMNSLTVDLICFDSQCSFAISASVGSNDLVLTNTGGSELEGRRKEHSPSPNIGKPPNF